MKKQILVRTQRFDTCRLERKLNEGYIVVNANPFELGIEYILEKEVEDLPTENAGKDGRWIVTIGRTNNDRMDFKCSECNYGFGIANKAWVRKSNINYCPCCGAKMKNVEDIVTL